MRKFVFTLQALLHLKESLEKQERHNLAGITRRLNNLIAEQEDMKLRRENASQTYGSRLAAGMLASETQQFTSYFRMMKELLEEQAQKILLAQNEVEACRQKLVEIMREIHMLQTLKDKQYKQYLQEAQIEDEKALGDFVSYQSTQKTADLD